MESFENHPRASLLARHRVLTAVLAVLILGSAAFAAAGGVAMVKSWFLTVSVNGNVVHTGEIAADGNGETTLTLPKGSLSPDGENSVTVQMTGTADESGGAVTKTITVKEGEKDVTVHVGSQPLPEPKPERPAGGD